MSRYTVWYHDRSEGLAAGGRVTIQPLYHDRRAVWLERVSRYNRLYRDRRKTWPLGVSQYNAATRPGICCDTAEEPTTRRAKVLACAQRHGRGLLRHDREGATTRSCVSHDTAQRAPRHDAVRSAWAQWARSLAQGVHLVHPTQFWTQCIVSVTVWTTVHEHCS